MKPKSSIEELTAKLEEFWNDKIPTSASPCDNLEIYLGWSSNDESDPNRYEMECYILSGNGRKITTGRGGILKMIREWNFIPNQLFLNGIEVEIEGFINAVKEDKKWTPIVKKK